MVKLLFDKRYQQIFLKDVVAIAFVGCYFAYSWLFLSYCVFSITPEFNF